MNFNIPKIVGIANITPDSFSGDGILSKSLPNIQKQLTQMLDNGADIIDIGAESTAPGSSAITQEEELERLRPIFEMSPQFTNLALDTTNSKTAKEAIQKGFCMINDVSGGRKDSEMFPLVAETGVQYVMMYCKNSSGRADLEDDQQSVYKKIIQFFDQQIEQAYKSGIKKEQLILDPGMGAFISAKAEDSLEVLKKIPELKKRYQLPLYIGVSRKGFLAKLTKYDSGISSRLASSLAAGFYAAIQGADYLRVHDVLETREFFEVFYKISIASPKEKKR